MSGRAILPPIPTVNSSIFQLRKRNDAIFTHVPHRAADQTILDEENVEGSAIGFRCRVKHFLCSALNAKDVTMTEALGSRSGAKRKGDCTSYLK